MPRYEKELTFLSKIAISRNRNGISTIKTGMTSN